MEILIYMPSTTSEGGIHTKPLGPLQPQDVVIVREDRIFTYVTRVREDSDMAYLYPGAIYGFRVKTLKTN